MPTPPHVLALRRKVGHDLLQLPGITAIVLDHAGNILLQKRSDFGVWHTLGGCVDPGESPADCCLREVLEETGLHVQILRLTGVYALPTVTYPNGDQASFISVTFLCRTLDPAPTPILADDESLDLRFFPPHALPPLAPAALRRLTDALAGRPEAAFDPPGHRPPSAHTQPDPTSPPTTSLPTPH